MGEFGIWVPINDAQHEGEWRDFYNHQALNFTPTWGKGEPNVGTTENCAVAKNSIWWDMPCNWQGPACLCQRQPSFHLRLRGLCADSAVDRYFKLMNDFSNFAKLQLVGAYWKSTIEYDEKSKKNCPRVRSTFYPPTSTCFPGGAEIRLKMNGEHPKPYRIQTFFRSSTTQSTVGWQCWCAWWAPCSTWPTSWCSPTRT